MIGWGIQSFRQIPIDAVPDITNNQVQIITIAPSLATQEVEQFITTPVELALQNLQRLEEIRQAHLALSTGDSASAELDTASMPVVVNT